MSYPKHFTMIKHKIGEQKPTLNIIGYIRAGEMKDDGLPKANPFFRMASEMNDYIDYFTHFFGEKPNSLPIYFTTSDRDISCIYQFEAWQSKRLWGYGDGETNMVWREEAKRFEPCEKDSELFKRIPYKAWQEYVTLRFKIAYFPGDGYFVLKTSGKDTSIPLILNTLQLAEQTMDGFENQLFNLTVEMSKSSKIPGSNYRYPIIKLSSKYNHEQRLMIQEAFLTNKIKRDELDTYLKIEKYLDSIGAANPKPKKLIKP